MPDVRPCPTCKGNAYSTPHMDGTRWHAIPGRGEVSRLQLENERLRAERAELVAFLRKEARATVGMGPVDRSECAAMIATSIEDGSWRKPMPSNSGGDP